MKNKKYLKIYADFLGKFLKPQKRLNVVFDCSNGAAGLVLEKIFKTYKFTNLKLINSIPDGNFPAHGPNPLKQFALRNLRLAILKHKADFGAIFDADADRVFFVDNLGRFINPDVIVKLLIWHLQPKKTIIDVRTGWLVRKSKIILPLTEQKTRIIISKVGHYFIKKLMRKIKADFAAEYSGHYYFKKFFYNDSAILAAIETINAVSKLPYQLSDFIDLLPPSYRSPELNFKVKNKENLIKLIEEKYKNKAKISKIDGITIELSDYWFNLRLSNTEELIRLNIEAASKEILKQKIRELKKVIVSS